MNKIDYTRAETLDVALFAADNLLAAGGGGLEKILQALEHHAGNLMPDRVEDVRYSRAAVERELAKQKSRPKVLLTLIRSAGPEVSYSLNFARPGSPVGFWLWMVVPFSYFEEAAHSEAHSRALVALVRALAGACRPLYGYGHSKGDLSLGSDLHLEDPFAPNRVYEMYWLNLYGSEMVEQLGRPRVLSTPAAQLEELPGGGVLLLTRPTPTDYASEEARVAQARALAHLRDDLGFDEALGRLRQRSATLAQVLRHWQSDIADLLELTLDTVAYAQRQQQTAKLNNYRAPEVSEWRPLADLLQPDVDDVEATVDRYRGLYAERLVALLHQDVPEVRQGGPESLPRIDYHFWRLNYPDTFKRADVETDLVPAVGAYLGEVLVHHLGGRWVPRRALDEAQVVVGDRAWLPFLRARYALQSKQSALDYSLTQFYRTAERFRTAGGGEHAVAT